jgi:hypothetical protein
MQPSLTDPTNARFNIGFAGIIKEKHHNQPARRRKEAWFAIPAQRICCVNFRRPEGLEPRSEGFSLRTVRYKPETRQRLAMIMETSLRGPEASEMDRNSND